MESEQVHPPAWRLYHRQVVSLSDGCLVWVPGPDSTGYILSCFIPETLYHKDDGLLYIAYVMLIWAAPIPADRWHCSLWP